MRRSSFACRTVPLALGVLALAVTTVSCSDADGSSSDSTAAESTTATNSSESTAPVTTTPETTTPETTAPETTTPETTTPETTTPETTSPATSAPSTTDAVIPGASDEEIAQFCFESEQVYIANAILSTIDNSPADAEAAMGFMVHSVDNAVFAAPTELADQPLAAQAALAELVPIFEEYDYDADAILEGPDGERATELVVSIGGIMEELTAFLSEVCGSQFAVLDSQAIKLSAVIAAAAGWSLLAVTNVAGDIRLLVPPEWTDWIGSVDVGEITFLQASPDNAAFDANWDVPGVYTTVFYVESGVADPTTRLAGLAAPAECTETAVEPYADPAYTGELHLYEACAGSSASAAVLLATDEELSVEIIIELQFPTTINRIQLDQILATFAAGA